MADYDIIGNIAIIKSERGDGNKKTKQEKLEQAKKLLKIPSIKTVLEKSSNVKGRLRTIKTKHVLGEKTLISEHKENNCRFRFNIETCYFSPRLSNERKEIALKINAKDEILVMFAGVGVYPIVIYKLIKPKKIIGVELGRECCNYFKENLRINKIPEEKIEVIQGDVKKKVNKSLGKFDIVLMPRPNLKDSFLEQGLLASKKGGRIFYYGFCNVDEINDMAKNLIKEAKKLKRKIKILEIKKAGDIAPYKFRYRIEIKVI